MMFPNIGCPTIGFDQSAWSFVTACCQGMSPIVNLASDVSRLGECKVVFGGNNVSCANAVRFSAGDWPAVRSYIEGGGRLFLVGEHSGEYPPGTPCLGDAATLNSFLSALGSTMAYVVSDYNNASPVCRDSYYSPGAANIAQGITFPGERFGEASGGTTVWLGPAGSVTSGGGKTAVAVEQLGSGFLFLSGDGNHGICGAPCNFIKRLWDYSDNEIL